MIHVEKQNSYDAKDLLLPMFIGAVFISIFIRLFYLQISNYDTLQKQAKWFNYATRIKHAPRGNITDRNGKLLAGIKTQLVLSVQSAKVLENRELADKLSNILEITPEKLEEKIKQTCWRPFIYTQIFYDLDAKKASQIAELELIHEGIKIHSEPLRFYEDPYMYSHLMGYVHTPNENDVKRISSYDRKTPLVVGKSGIEYKYELDLMGTPGGDSIEVDVRSRPLRLSSSNEPIPGKQLQLTIDKNLQETAYQSLQGLTGAAVAIEPSTGEILCMASNPSYNLETFMKGISFKDWKTIQNDKNYPMLNRAISSSYAPASTFKTVIAMAAMEKGIFSVNYRVPCAGYYKVGNRRIRCLGAHGNVNFYEALAKSCNPYFVDLALKVGINDLRKTFDNLGLGDKTGVDIGGEASGVIPTEAWIRKWRNPAYWLSGDTANLGLGQGELSITPIQQANIATIIANKGKVFKPHLLKSDTKLSPERNLNISRSNWDILHKGMNLATKYGTVSRYQIPGVEWCAKTGSAQHKKGEQVHSWCIAFAPMDNPKIAVCVLAESAGYGSSFAAPIAKKLIEQYLFPARYGLTTTPKSALKVDIN